MKFCELIQQKSKDLQGEAPVTIAFLGDSITQGCFELYKTGDKSIDTIFESKSAYGEKLKFLFSNIYPNVPLNIINAGISGGNAPNGMERIERDILKYNPNLVVICFGLNDCNGGIEKLDTYKESLRNIFIKLSQENIETIFMTPNMMNTNISPNISDEFIKEIARNSMILQNEGILEAYVKGANDICAQENIVVCDCYEKWKILSKKGVNITNLLSNYINHPTREMHWLFANTLFEMIMFK